MAIAGLGATVAAMSYPLAIVLPKSEADAINLIHLSVRLGILVSLGVALILCGTQVEALFGVQAISYLLYLLPVYMLVAVVHTVASQWLVRQRNFPLLAKVSVWQALATGMIKIAFGFLHPTASILVIANVLGAALGAALMVRGAKDWFVCGSRRLRFQYSGRGTRAIGKQYIDFALLRTPQALLNAISQSLPVIVLSAFVGADAAGFYAIAIGAVALPVNLVGQSVAHVFYPKMADMVNANENPVSALVRATAFLGLSAFLPFVGLIYAAPPLFATIFGSEWQSAGVYAQWLAVLLFMQLVSRPAVSAIPALRLQGGLLLYEMLSTGAKFAALVAAYHLTGDDITSIAYYSCSGAVAYACLALWVIWRASTCCKEGATL